jgi:molybdopterin-containing oxidoreductase family membrane subunit
MWIERYIIVVASLRVPQMPYANPARYLPSGVELAISAGALALFALLITLFSRFLPVVSIWEVREHAEERVPALALASGEVVT